MELDQGAVRSTFAPAGVGEARPPGLVLQVYTRAVAAAVDLVVAAVIRPRPHDLNNIYIYNIYKGHRVVYIYI